MKKIIVTVSVIFSILCSVCATENSSRRSLTPEEKAARRQMMRERRAARIAAAGGMVTKAPQGNYARIVSAQSSVSTDKIKELVEQFNSGLHIWIAVDQIEPEKNVWETLKKARAIPKTGLVTLIVEEENFPRILSALEEGWSVLNIKGLKDDMPPKAVYDERVRKELNRAFAQSAGAGLSYSRPCVMEPAYTLTDLDKISFPVISPEVMSKIQAACNKRHIDSIRTLTYRSACEEGWAPSPTNDIQRAIWKEVHSIPTNPIKIKFDSKRDAGK